MCSLQDVTDYAMPDAVPIYEKGGRLCTMPLCEIASSNSVLEFYPQINLNCEVFSSSVAGSVSSRDSRRSVLIPVNEGVLKRVTRTFFENGFMEALNEARDVQTAAVSPLISSMAEFTFRAMDFMQKLKERIFPNLREQGIESIAKYVETRNWLRSYVRCIDWHPNCFKIAVAGADDIIRIYTDEPAVVPVLKSATQKWITAMAWRPFSATELAVGCQKGVFLWSIDNNMHITRTSSQAVLLKHANHAPISSLQWNTDGTLLATASISDADVLIWNVDKMQNAILKRVGSACSLLKWSPDGSCLFATTVGNVFRVWSADKKWSAERWTIKAGTVKSASWSPCGAFLLFVTTEDPFLYRLQFFEEQLFTSGCMSKQALPIADLSKCNVGHREVGGQPQTIAWDPNGRYLAITFKDSSCIAIFGTCIRKFNLNISPACFLTGIGAEFPTFICFQSKHRKNADTVLTIGWSSGRIQYFPFLNM